MAVWQLYFTLSDGEGHSSTTSINLPDTITDFADLVVAAGGYGTLLEDISDAVLIAVNVSRILLAGTGVADAASDVEEKARFIWQATGTTKRVIQSIPAFIKAKIMPNTNRVDLTDTDVDAWYDAMVTGLTIGADTFVPKDTEGRDIIGLKAATQAYTRSRT